MAGRDIRKEAVKRLAIENAVVSGTQQVYRVYEEISQTDDASGDEYAAQKLQAASEESTVIAGNVTLETVRSAYIRFKAPHEIAVSQENNAPQVDPEGRILVSGDDAVRNEEIKDIAVKKHIVGQKVRKDAPTSSASHSADRQTAAQQRSKQRRMQEAARQMKMEQLRKQVIRQKAAGKQVKKLSHRSAGVAKSLKSGKRQAAAESVRQTLQELWQSIKTLLAKIASKIGTAIWPILLIAAVVLVVVLLFGSITPVVGSPVGILFADEVQDPDAIPISTIISEINAEFEAEIAAEIAAHPECDEVKTHYLYPDGTTWTDYWPEILALYAVDESMNRGGNVIVLDTESKNRIRVIFWQMHSIDAVVETVEVPSENDFEQDASTNETMESSSSAESDKAIEESSDIKTAHHCILQITINGKTVEQLATELRFTQEQQRIIYELLSGSI